MPRRSIQNAKRSVRHRLPRASLQPWFERLQGWSLAGMGIGSAVWDLDESGEQRFIERFNRWPGPHTEPIHCVDVGANRGDYARLLARGLGPEDRVHCFEPAAATFEELHRSLGNEPTCVLHRAGLGAIDGDASLYTVPGHSQLASLYGHDERAEVAVEPVAVQRLDSWAERQGVNHIALLKIDVEGAELDVLRGGTDLIEGDAIDVIQFEFGRRNQLAGATMEDFFVLLDGYVMHRMVVDGLRVLPHYQERLELPVSATNYVAIRQGITGLT